MLVQGPARFEPCAVRHGSPKHQAFANAANAAGGINAALGLLGHRIFTAVAKIEWAMLAHLSLVKDCAASRAVARLDNGIQFINRTH